MSEQPDALEHAVAALEDLDAREPHDDGLPLDDVATALERVADAVDAELDALRAQVPHALADG